MEEKMIKEIYQKLTGIDIEEQRDLWDDRGKGYYGEYLVFKEIYPYIDGCCKILMNLEIPSHTGGTTEIDLLMIHETGIYVFEIKHFKGTIYGKVHENRWTQYFRTAQNNTFRNPVEQNQYHIQSLQKMYHGIPIYSFIVFTSDECELRVTGENEKIDIGTVRGLRSRLERRISEKDSIMSMESIDSIFKELLPYAPDSNKEVVYNEQSVPFYQLADTIKEHSKRTINLEKIKLAKVVIVTVGICIFILVSIIFFAFGRIKASEIVCNEYQKKYEELEQKFVKVEYLNNGELAIRDDIVTVTEVKLEKSEDILNMLHCDIWINVTSEDYGIQIPQEAKIIIILKNGEVHEYEYWGEQHKYNEISSRVGISKNPVRLLAQEFYDIEVADISQIKIIGITLWRWENKTWAQREDILTEMELEVYDAE